MSNNNWYNFGKLLAVCGMILTPIAAVMPDPYSKIMLAVVAGLGNASAYAAFGKLEPKE